MQTPTPYGMRFGFSAPGSFLGPPPAARSVGQGMREFRVAITGSGRASAADDAPAIPPSVAAAEHEQRA